MTKLANIEILIEKFFETSEGIDLMNLNEIFRKDLTCDSIKSYKKLGFHPLFRRYIFRKTTRVQVTPPPSSRFSIKENCIFVLFYLLVSYYPLKFRYKLTARSDGENNRQSVSRSAKCKSLHLMRRG